MTNHKLTFLLFLGLWLSCPSVASPTYKILIFPLSGKSHVFSMAAMAEDLANRGHKVSFVIGESFPLKIPEMRNGSKITVVKYKDTEDGEAMDYDAMEENITRMMMEQEASNMQLGSLLKNMTEKWSRMILEKNDDVWDKLAEEKFNVAVIDGLFMMKSLYLIPHRLQIPWITYCDVVDPFVVRVPWLPSFVPVQLLPYNDKMRFHQRLVNSAAMLAFSFLLPLQFPNPPPHIMTKYQQYGSFESLDDLMSRSVLWLLTKDNVLDYPRPMMPNIVNIGGLTVKRTIGQLPDDINNFIEGAKKGTILVTFGSAASSFPAHIVQKFTSAFQELDGYRVIWRLNNRDNIPIPENVIVAHWLPQNDILAHTNVKLFITHSGNNGQFEAVYHAVPMIGFPIAGDQVHNARRLDYKGYGMSMDLYNFTADQLLNNIHQVLSDKSYKERITKASKIFRSQVQSPLERATYWIEHVCEFGGEHLRSSGNDLPLYAYFMLDIIIIVVIVIFVVVKLCCWIIRKICCRRRRSSKGKLKTQ